MGWDGIPKTKSTQGHIAQHVNSIYGERALKICMGAPNEFYVAVQDGDSVRAVVFLTNEEDGYLYIKGMGEDEGPFYYNCPSEILNLLTEPKFSMDCLNYNALTFRMNCWKKIANA